jgi:HlyD family secretion protein
MKIPSKRLVPLLALLAAAALVALLLRPRPVEVDTAPAVRGPLLVTLDEEGETRVRHRYLLGAPVAGRLVRLTLEEGDPVAAGQVVAQLDPAPLDPRGREQAEARLAAARAASREATAQVAHQQAALAEARRQLQRAARLAAEKILATAELDAARTAVAMAESDLDAARFRARAAGWEAESARAALLEAPAGGAAGGRALALRAPVAGSVLRICQECEKVVEAGAELLEIGDPRALEVVVDVLSNDAVRIPPGAPMLLTAGDGSRELRAKVRLVEPAAFTKVSPLGVEEQRVDVVGDLLDPPGRLGDRYRVEVRIVLWEGRDVLKVPAGALFRSGTGQAVFTVEAGRARRREVTVGHRNPDEAEILSGLAAGEPVIVHPSDAVADGIRVQAVTLPGR